MKSLNAIAEQQLAPPPAENNPEDLMLRDEEYVRLRARLPKGVNVEDAMDFGFFEHKHRYWIRRREDSFEPVSNFTLKVLYLIMGANPKRIVEIRNVHGKTATLDFSIEDLISLDKFKARVESVGNFLFEGKATDLGKIKNKLFTLEKPSIEIARLGQHKNLFWTWANGIYHGEKFHEIDEKGMVTINSDNFYIPVFGETRADDDEDLRNYRRFLHRDSAVTFKEWAQLFCQVYGENGQLGIAFACFSLFSDIIFDRTKAAPMLFLFGQRGSGKGTMAISLMSLWGYPQDPLMLGGASTVVGFMRKLGQFSNAIIWLDEYKNDIGERKIESLKNIWDRVGYERGVKDSSNRTQTTPVTSCAIVSGQDMPNVEPALFSRCVLCEFRAMHRKQEEVDQFNSLRRMEDGGITSATMEILKLREKVRADFMKHYAEISSRFRQAYLDADVIERQIINYSILVAVVACLETHLVFPFNSAGLMLISEKFIKRQRDMMKTSNEVQQFFEMVAFLLSIKEITPGNDIQIAGGVVKIRMVAILPLYREYSKRQGIKSLDKGTLINYLQNSEAYDETESKKTSHRFTGLQSPTSAIVFLQSQILKSYGVDFSENSQTPDNQEEEKKPAPF